MPSQIARQEVEATGSQPCPSKVRWVRWVGWVHQGHTKEPPGHPPDANGSERADGWMRGRAVGPGMEWTLDPHPRWMDGHEASGLGPAQVRYGRQARKVRQTDRKLFLPELCFAGPVQTRELQGCRPCVSCAAKTCTGSQPSCVEAAVAGERVDLEGQRGKLGCTCRVGTAIRGNGDRKAVSQRVGGEGEVAKRASLISGVDDRETRTPTIDDD